MMIVDAQIHLWAKGTPAAHHRQEPYTPEQALVDMDAAGIDRALNHPPMWDPDSNELAVEAASAHPDRFATLGWFPLDRPQSRSLVDTWKSRPGMLGLRFYFNQPYNKTWPTDGTIDWLWPAAERAGVPIALAASSFLPVVQAVAERHPGLRLIVDHMAAPGGTKGEVAYRNLPQLLALAKYPNVAVKATAQPAHAEDTYPFRSIHEPLRRVYDAFGPQRMFWGTDITRMPCSWRQCVTLFTEELPWLSESDKELIMGRALCDWLGWSLPG